MTESTGDTRFLSVKVDYEAWGDFQTRGALRMCGRCKTFDNPAKMENGLCRDCKPVPTHTLENHMPFTRAQCGCAMERNENGSISLFHCTPEPAPEAPALDAERLTELIAAWFKAEWPSVSYPPSRILHLAKHIVGNMEQRVAAQTNGEALMQEVTALDEAWLESQILAWLTVVETSGEMGYSKQSKLLARHITNQQEQRAAAQAELVAMATEPEPHLHDWKLSIGKDQKYCFGCDTHRKAQR